MSSPFSKQAARLRELATRSWDISDLVGTPGRLEKYVIRVGEIDADLSKHLIDDDVLAALINFAREAGVIEHAHRKHRGEIINVTEQRAVMHVALRTGGDGTDAFAAEADEQRQRMRDITDAVRDGSWQGTTG